MIQPKNDLPGPTWARALVFFLCIFVLSSCAGLIQRAAVLNCRYSFAEVVPLDFRLTTINLRLSIRIDNPNAIQVILDRLGFEFFVNGRRVFEGIMQERLVIPSQNTSYIEHMVRVSTINAGTAIISAIKNRRATYRLTGKAYFSTPIGRFVFPVDIISGEIR